MLLLGRRSSSAPFWSPAVFTCASSFGLATGDRRPLPPARRGKSAFDPSRQLRHPAAVPACACAVDSGGRKRELAPSPRGRISAAWPSGEVPVASFRPATSVTPIGTDRSGQNRGQAPPLRSGGGSPSQGPVGYSTHMLEDSPRYLVPFHPKRRAAPLYRRADHRRRAGRAAGRAGGRSEALGPGDHQGRPASNRTAATAQGGIAGVIDPEDRFEDHIADTLTAGGKLCDPAVVEMVVREAPDADRRIDRLGHPLRLRRRIVWRWARRRTQPPSHRPRPGRRHRQGSDAGRDRARRQLTERRDLANTPSRSIC